MEEIISHLNQSLVDEVLSKNEKRKLKELVAEKMPSADQLNFLRNRLYELANAKVTDSNYRFVLEWIKEVNATLLITHSPPADKSNAFFSPGESCRNAIINEINLANKQLKLCVFTISDDRITESILAAHRRKLDIKIITDNDKSLDLGSDILQLAKAGVVTRMDITRNHMHHKFMVADCKTLITGSYNWTRSAAMYNHENVVLTSEVNLVNSFLNEFDLLWQKMV